ncbi:HD-GYP domain-containing protein [Herbaspirillum seropedicae]|uniref:HD-GYP domain containing protein n=1 Tax=Herbaspirillum seropedicae (strain SmR1) TaxID=757424 RepID=D8IY83_HERSS|nr:HD-GYP domain-containing protein [Herbaspirillum seropedicae]ADJ66205.1 HD-GYP domain containing protein [Herbaspirillum seropedicae SmR1]AKN67960.1 phosphodiesterase [Herbaspirillum seropedicae]NQE30048.1 phosphodiesterase [Herbaspirillum seropedicae]UMU24000.1 HD-GYP domain-containing protein [Herbaspirillum seropedicae]
MLKSIALDQLRLGMYIHSIPGGWISHPFRRKSFKVETLEDLQTLRDCPIDAITINTAKGRDVTREELEEDDADQDAPAAPPADAANRNPASRTDTAIERERAQRIISSSKSTVLHMFSEARMGKAIDVKDAAELVTEITASVSRNADALISLARLKTTDDYTYLHSVAVCAMMISLANQLGMTPQQTKQAGMAGLLHDVGKMAVPLDILNKPAKLTEEEFASVRMHTVQGHGILQQIEGIGEVALDVSLHHHEKIDGSGYPFNLKADSISIMAKMGAVCDVYDAITSNRPYKAGWDPARSIRHMAASAGHFDPITMQAFVKAIGIYPTGSCVMLQSGRLGVVVDQRPDQLLTPRVKVFYSTANRMPLESEIIDLAHSSDKITAYADPAKWGIGNLPGIELL